MSELFAEFDGTFKRPPPVRDDCWIVLALWQGQYWTQPSAANYFYRSREAAEKAASQLAPGWTDVEIWKIPGTKHEQA